MKLKAKAKCPSKILRQKGRGNIWEKGCQQSGGNPQEREAKDKQRKSWACGSTKFLSLKDNLTEAFRTGRGTFHL